MADYVPNTIVRVLKDVPLDDTYTDTRWFSNKGQQTSFFTGKAKYSFTDMTYQRVNNGIAQPRVALTCRVPMIADNLYDCNYMMFQNSNYGSRWFYAFIKQVNYINPNNTELVYEIDYLQTFMFDLEIKASFVEREHASAAEDKMFKNLVPEPVGVSSWCEDLSQQAEWSYYDQAGGTAGTRVICVAVMPSDVVSAIFTGLGTLVNGVYTGGSLWSFDTSEGCNRALLALGAIGHSQDVVGIWMLPIKPETETGGAGVKSVSVNLSAVATKFSTRTGDYVIRNYKLLNSQFTYIKGYSSSGDTQVWKPELLEDSARTGFKGFCYHTSTDEFEMLFYPYYESGGHVADDMRELEYSLSLQMSIHCPWTSYGWMGDAVKSAGKLLLGGIVGGVAGAAVGGASSMAVAGGEMATSGSTAVATTGTELATRSAGTVGPSMTAFHEKLGMWSSVVNPQGGTGASGGYTGGSHTTFTPNTENIGHFANMLTANEPALPHGGGGHIMQYATNMIGFTFKRMCATSDELERLDTFFDMFGYQVNKVKVPNLDTREAWNYVKLAKPCIYGSVPVEGMAIIKSAFSRGIRLWHVDAVGDYSIQNPPK